MLRDTFGLDSVAVLDRVDIGWRAEFVSGGPLTERPDANPYTVDISDGPVLVRPASSEPMPTMPFCEPLSAALRQRRIGEQLARLC